ncbi:MAG: DHH family phosphoesterase [Rikenellaceae bacterium]
MTTSEFKESLLESKNIVILSHQNPDGDAIGSALSLCRFLKTIGNEATVIMPNETADTMSIIYGYDTVIYNNKDSEKAATLVEKAEILIFVDLNDIKTRIGDIHTAVERNTTAKRAIIDHHVSSPDPSIDFIYADSTASSTGLLIYRLISDMGMADKIDIETANAMYIGMMTDTGNFSYGFLTSELFETVAKLIKIGISPQILNGAIYNTNSEERMRLWGYVMSEKMVILHDLKAAYITLTTEELRRFKYKEGDTEGLVNVPLSIAGIENSAMFSEKEGFVRISLRSTGQDGEDMNVFAHETYNGGGHRNASGARSKESMEMCVVKFVDGMRKARKK